MNNTIQLGLFIIIISQVLIFYLILYLIFFFSYSLEFVSRSTCRALIRLVLLANFHQMTFTVKTIGPKYFRTNVVGLKCGMNASYPRNLAQYLIKSVD